MAVYSKQLALELYNLGCVKFETITLKSVQKSICKLFLTHLMKELNYDVIVGVPLTALSFAKELSSLSDIPMLMTRKETKNYGTKTKVDGIYVEGQRALVVEDIISSGGSILETVVSLRKEGLIVQDVVVVLDREQGGIKNLENLGIRVHSLIKISELFALLVEEKLLNNDKSVEILDWIRGTEVRIQDSVIQNYKKLSSEQGTVEREVLSYEERAKLTENKIAKRLFKLMVDKKSNLCVAVDEKDKNLILDIVDKVGPNVVMIKLHCDVIGNFDQGFVNDLKKLASQHQFLVFEDRKFADIGNTVKDQFTCGLFKINEWADLVDCHATCGESTVESLKSVADLDKNACLIVAELSNKGNLITNAYTEMAVKFGENHPEFVIGFVSQSKLTTDQRFIHFTPGVNLQYTSDELDQKYVTPNQAIKERGADVIIVGRGISQSKDPAKTSKIYQEEAYTAYKELLIN